LPAGEYHLDLQSTGGAPLQGQLALRVARRGEPLVQWTLDGSTRWSTRFSLPVDARYVGLVAPPDLTDVRVEVRPVAIADLSTRRPDLEVHSGRTYGPAAVFFYDGRTFPEDGGFWISGDDEARFAVAAQPQGRIALRVRAGAVPVALRLRIGSTTRHLRLAAGAVEEVPLAATRQSVTQVEVATTGGFVPARVDPASGDRRFLGCWVEIAG
jgi:hypothetical protein